MGVIDLLEYFFGSTPSNLWVRVLTAKSRTHQLRNSHA
jgi:hypothetical protein